MAQTSNPEEATCPGGVARALCGRVRKGVRSVELWWPAVKRSAARRLGCREKKKPNSVHALCATIRPSSARRISRNNLQERLGRRRVLRGGLAYRRHMLNASFVPVDVPATGIYLTPRLYT